MSGSREEHRPHTKPVSSLAGSKRIDVPLLAYTAVVVLACGLTLLCRSRQTTGTWTFPTDDPSSISSTSRTPLPVIGSNTTSESGPAG